jgi:hypothetical protein
MLSLWISLSENPTEEASYFDDYDSDDDVQKKSAGWVTGWEGFSEGNIVHNFDLLITTTFYMHLIHPRTTVYG